MTATRHVCSYSFSHEGQELTVTMIDPDVPPDGSTLNPYPSMIYDTPPRGFREPITAFGFFFPATFRVDGLPHRITFTTGQVEKARKPQTKHVGIVSVHVESDSGGAITREVLGSVPLGRLLAASIHAAGLVVIHYPPGYDGKWLRWIDGELHPIENARIATDEGTVEAVCYRGLPTPPDLHVDLTGRDDPVKDENRLRRVAATVKAAERAGRPRERDVMKVENVGERQARRLISDARDAGLLPPVPRSDRRGRGGRK